MPASRRRTDISHLHLSEKLCKGHFSQGYLQFQPYLSVEWKTLYSMKVIPGTSGQVGVLLFKAQVLQGTWEAIPFDS